MTDTTFFRLISQYDDNIINVTDPVIVGRQKTCGFVLPYDSISREHARLSFTNNLPLVEDLGSSNGTFVNNEKISKIKLNSGDIVAFDQYLFQVEIARIPQRATQEHYTADEKQEKAQTGAQTPTVLKEDAARSIEVPKPIKKTPVDDNPIATDATPQKPVSDSIQDQELVQNNTPDKSLTPQSDVAKEQPKPEAKQETQQELKQESKVEIISDEKPEQQVQSSKEAKVADGANWWEKGDAGPKSTMFMDALDPSLQNANQEEIPEQSFNEPVLYGISGPVQGTVIKLKQGSMMLGRSDTCDYQIDSKHISDKHAQLIFEPPTLRVIGMPNTTNGTFVNGDKTGGSVYLKSGDLLSFGPIQFKVQLGANGANKTSSSKSETPRGSALRFTLIATIIITAITIGGWYLLKAT